jgi:hypothetical protein
MRARHSITILLQHILILFLAAPFVRMAAHTPVPHRYDGRDSTIFASPLARAAGLPASVRPPSFPGGVRPASAFQPEGPAKEKLPLGARLGGLGRKAFPPTACVTLPPPLWSAANVYVRDAGHLYVPLITLPSRSIDSHGLRAPPIA